MSHKVTLLIHKLNNGSRTDRIEAAIQLRKLGPEAAPAIHSLIQTLNSEDAPLVNLTKDALCSVGEDVIPFLTKASRSGPLTLRSNVIWVLGQFSGQLQNRMTILETLLTAEESLIASTAQSAIVSLSINVTRNPVSLPTNQKDRNTILERLHSCLFSFLEADFASDDAEFRELVVKTKENLLNMSQI